MNGEEIISTPDHPFYVPKKGWIGAIDLHAGDILVLQSGEYVVVELIQHEILETPVTVYNFEVEDFHTYYVSESAVLVHNECKPNSPVKVNQNALKKIDVHAFKKEFVKNNVSRWDVFKDTANSSVLWLGDKAQKVWHETGMYMDDLINIFPKR